MIDAATLPDTRLRAARVELPMPITQEGLQASLRQAFTWARPFAANAADVQVLGNPALNAGIGTMLRPIATPLAMGGFDANADTIVTMIEMMLTQMNYSIVAAEEKKK